MNIAVIDNYDSFTYNLVHAIKKRSGLPVDVFRNDELELEELGRYAKIILSPGPGLPEEAGLLMDIIRTYAPRKSMLGVCLGHQAIGQVFGARLKNMSHVLHGIAGTVTQIQSDPVLFENIPRLFEAGRYHSWIIDQEGFPECLEVTSLDEDGRIMSLKHRLYDVRGVQFHPESVLTPYGEKIIANWLKTETGTGRPEAMSDAL
ncbi:MAG: aminodeoxychorismate/anthranilate synthase component II [Mangrovibacterium sp.]|nr:aminodeoxychorismate/anthranilate synthase component II [Mangrovibacterium sp.]